jgi:hypothetical protein
MNKKTANLREFTPIHPLLFTSFDRVAMQILPGRIAESEMNKCIFWLVERKAL